ncbi:MAG: acyl-CoA thioesterase [Planctomycetota bacterium]
MADRELVIKVIAMPRDANPDGDIFGGWLVGQMDLAAYYFARKRTESKIVTVAQDNIVIHRPVSIGDCVLCYAQLERVGTTSVTVRIDALVERRLGKNTESVTEGRFTLVAIDNDRRPVRFTSNPASAREG